MPAEGSAPEKTEKVLLRNRSGNTTGGKNNLVHFHWPKAKKTPNRLIDIHTLKLKHFAADDVPPYAILSHRWTDDELSYKDFLRWTGDALSHKGLGQEAFPGLKGYTKIASFCSYIKHLNVSGEGGQHDYSGPKVEYVWVDTCCIDKRSSAELSEAVNSMANWYKYSAFCVAYLHDVVDASSNDWMQLRNSDWFTRGWTLQELIFPPTVAFCNQYWDQFMWMNPFKTEAIDLISEISGVPATCLRNSRLIADESIANRMSWASKRKTTRKEDEAYCLLGILDINMPLIYGEGERAFIRLQEEIIRQVDDESIFAWHITADSRRMFPLLATSPSQFQDCNIEIQQVDSRKPYNVTNQGLEFIAPSIKLHNVSLGPNLPQHEVKLIQLNCCSITIHGDLEPCCLALVKRSDNDLWRRVMPERNTWLILSAAAEKIELCEQATHYIALDPMNRKLMYRDAKEEDSRTVPILRKALAKIPVKKPLEKAQQ